MARKLTSLLLLILLMTACAPVVTPQSQDEITQTLEPVPTEMLFMDGLGRMITLPAVARRIVSLTPAGTEILFAVGAGTQVVGRDMFSDYPVEATSIQDIGGSMGEYNLEAIVSLTPDLVLAGGINSPELVAALEDLGLVVFFLPNPISLEDMFATLLLVGSLTGHAPESAALVDSLSSRVAAVDVVIQPISYRPSVFYELDATNPAAPYTAGPGTFVDLLIARAGGSNIGAALEGEWATISVEQLLVTDPSIILLGDAAWGETPEKVAARPGWETLSAVRNGKIYPFDDNLVSRPGPRLVDGLEALVQLFHPGALK